MDLIVLLPEVNQPRQLEFSFSRDLELQGSNMVANRQAAVTTAPAPGPEGNTLPVASLF